MTLSDLSIRRPVLALVASLLIVVIGIASLLSIPVRELPDVDSAIVTVTTTYTGASPDIIDTDNLPTDRLVFGLRAVLENVDTGENVEYMLVGPDESDIDEGRISVTSPLGRAMIGKEIGEEVIVAAPAGKRVYEIVDIV